jgi:hypothetical protein
MHNSTWRKSEVFTSFWRHHALDGFAKIEWGVVNICHVFAVIAPPCCCDAEKDLTE